VRHWGGAYEGFVILDADSVMSGACLATLARLMAENSDAALIQTFTVAVNRETAFARALQFVHRLVGPMLAEGHAWWQGGDANYFGHNALIRTRAFAAHCGLPALSGTPPFGGEILSHDFVEAALLRRGGWRVYAVPRLEGSYEEVPSNVIDYAARDRRWLQGNLQHAMVIPSRGIPWLSRFHLIAGILSFLASPLWLALVLGAVTMSVAPDAAVTCCTTLIYGIRPETLDAHTEIGTLLALTAAMLLLPRALGAALALLRGRLRRTYGGVRLLLGSTFAELILSTLIAPSLMLLHTAFIAATIAGKAISWRAQPRDDRGVAWRDATKRLWWVTAAGVALTAYVALRTPDLAPWLSPVMAGLLLAIPLCVFSSRPAWGRSLARLGLFAIPEERARPRVLQQRDEALAQLGAKALPTADDLARDPTLVAAHALVTESRYAARGQFAAPRK
jgi:membrane glycosyltransferase